MEKILSIRPTTQICQLFNEIKGVDLYQETDRSAIISRALDETVGKNIDWKAVSAIKIKENTIEQETPDFMKIKVDADKYESVVEEIKNVFLLARVTAPYLVRLLLTNYLVSLKAEEKKEIISSVEKVVNVGIDGLVFKKDYDMCDYPQKEILLALCRRYLESCNPKMNESIRKQVNKKIKAYSDYFNINKYYPPKRSTLGTCNIVFVSKILAGLFITIAEFDGIELSEVIESLETNMKFE